MRFPKYIPALLLFLLHASTTFANNPKDTRFSFSCPQEIDCLESGNPSSCKAVGSDTSYQYYMQITGQLIAGTSPLKGAYSFVGSTVDSIKNKPSLASCEYNLINSSIITDDKKFFLQNKISTSIEHQPTQHTKWNEISVINDNLHAKCSSKSSLDCPLIESAGIIFYNVMITNPQAIEHGGGPLIRFNANFNNITWIQNNNISGSTMFVPLDTGTKSGCGKQCIIKMTLGLSNCHGAWNYFNAGNVTVDLTDNMKILSVYSDPTLPDNIKLEYGPHNTIIFSGIPVCR